MSRAPKKPIQQPDERSRANRWAPLAVIVMIVILLLSFLICLQLVLGDGHHHAFRLYRWRA